MNIQKKNLVLILVGTFFFGAICCFGLTALLHSQGIGTAKISQKEYQELLRYEQRYGKLDALWGEVSEKFYKDVDEEALKNALYHGLFKGLDDIYSGYMTKEEYESWKTSTLGELEGIGVTFTKDQADNIIITDIAPNGPAKKAGIAIGDILTMVDDKPYTQLEDIGAAMRGKAGTRVKITYLRDGSEHSVELTREKIINQSVTSSTLEGNIGYIQISAFEEATAADFEAALKDMEVNSVNGVVIDLRNNGGGLVNSGTQIADLLLGEGTITYLEDKHGQKKVLSSDSDKTALPYILLINEKTASTSEILAAAVKDSNPGKIVGTTSFGKGIVQSTTQLKDGSAFKLTTMQYFSPKGNQIHEKGVAPDHEVSDPDSQLQKALELLQ
ncbi:MAG: S41 family peptidase [Anaerovoracaceae bacterium]